MSAPRRLLWSLLLAPSLAGAAPEKVVVDSDGAFFNDDGAALVMLLRSTAAVELLGVTVCSGNEWSAQAAEYLLHALELGGRPGLPLHLGADLPLLNGPERARAAAELWGAGWTGAFGKKRPEGREGLSPPHGGRFARARPSREGAVPFLIGSIERHPGEVTVLALGPMTNLALALRQRPGLDRKIKRLVFMGGAAGVPGNTTPAAEFNMWFDPEAARIVLGSEIPEKVMFGLDITEKARLDRARFDRVVAVRTPVTELYEEDLGRRYPGLLEHPERTAGVWDALAALYLVDPSFVASSREMWVAVDEAFGPGYGRTHASPKARGSEPRPVRVMLDLDFERFFGLYLDLLTRR